MLSVKQKIYLEGTTQNFDVSYGSTTFNPSTNKEVFYISVGALPLVLTIPIPLKDGSRYYLKVNYTDDVTSTFKIDGTATDEIYFTQSGTIKTISLTYVSGACYIDSIEVIEVDAHLLDLEQPLDIKLTKFKGTLTDINNIVTEYTEDFNIVNNEKAKEILIYPNDNRISYIGVLNEIQGILIIGEKNDKVINCNFVSDIVNLIERLKNTTLKQCDISSETFNIKESNIGDDGYCHYNFVDKGNLTYLSYNAPVELNNDFDLTATHLQPSVKVVKLLESLFSKIGYFIHGNILSNDLFKALSLINFDNYKDTTNIENKCDTTNETTIYSGIIDNLQGGSLPFTLSDNTNNFNTLSYKSTYNSYVNFSAKTTLQATTITAGSDGNEYAYPFDIGIAYNYLIFKGSEIVYIGQRKVTELHSYETKEIEFDLDFDWNIISNEDYYLKIYMEVYSSSVSFAGDEFADFDYSDIVELSIAGTWDINEYDTIRSNTDYDIRKLLPDSSGYDFLKAIINNFNLQIELENNTLILYTFDEYFVTNSTSVDLTNKINNDIVNVMPTNYLSKNYKWSYKNEIGQNELYSNNLELFTSNNCEGNHNIKYPYSIINQTDKLLNLITSNTKGYRLVNPYTPVTLEGTFLIVQEIISDSKDFENEVGNIIALSEIPTASLRLGNKTLALLTHYNTFADSLKSDYFDRYLNDLTNPNGYKLKVKAKLSKGDYDGLNKNTFVSIKGVAYIIDSISNFNEKTLTDLELIKTTVNYNYTGTLPSTEISEITFDPVGRYETINLATPYTSGALAVDVTSSNIVPGTTCKIKVVSNSGNKYQYSTDNGGSWNNLTVGLEITIVTNGTYNFHIRLNSVDNGIYVLNLDSYYGTSLSNSNKTTYIVEYGTIDPPQSYIDGNINNGDTEIINETSHNDL